MRSWWLTLSCRPRRKRTPLASASRSSRCASPNSAGRRHLADGALFSPARASTTTRRCSPCPCRVRGALRRPERAPRGRGMGNNPRHVGTDARPPFRGGSRYEHASMSPPFAAVRAIELWAGDLSVTQVALEWIARHQHSQRISHGDGSQPTGAPAWFRIDPLSVDATHPDECGTASVARENLRRHSVPGLLIYMRDPR